MERFPKLNVIFSIVFLFFLLFLLGTYSNTFNASWQFDDKPNILNNSPLKITDLKPGTLWSTFFAKPGQTQGRLYRPLPCLTFALNWYWGQGDSFGFHFVNVIIHLINATLLYFTIFTLFRTPNLKGKYSHHQIYQIAFFGAALWAINPIQTQAVTYIVQRMASMAAMFYLLGILLHIKGRLTRSIKQKKMFIAGTILCFLGAMGSKENGILLPFSLMLVEIIFFQDNKVLSPRKKIFFSGVVCVVIILFLGTIFVLRGYVLTFFQGYNIRSFSLTQRLLTEPRIVLYYLSQIFYPIPSRLSIEHDVLISVSLFTSWTTLPAILSCTFLLGVGICQIDKRPLLAFGILFYFLNHAVESTIIPLELIFEHRNYLPSFFLFAPLISFMIEILKKYSSDSPIVKTTLATLAGFLIVALGFGTYIRNQSWNTELSLWEDAMRKAPEKARPLNNLGVCLAWGESPNTQKTEAALRLFEKAIFLKQPRKYFEADILGNIGNIYLERKEYKTAADYYRRALAVDQNFIKARYDLVKPLVLMGNWQEAEYNIDLLLENNNNNPDYNNLKGLILLWQNRAKESVPYLTKALLLAPHDQSILLNAGVSLSMTGQSQKANYFLNLASQNCPKDMIVLLALIENTLKVGKINDAKVYTDQLINSFNTEDIKATVEKLSNFFAAAPISKEIVAPWLEKTLSEQMKRG